MQNEKYSPVLRHVMKVKCVSVSGVCLIISCGRMSNTEE